MNIVKRNQKAVYKTKRLKSYFLNATRNFSYLCQFLFNWPSYAEKNWELTGTEFLHARCPSCCPAKALNGTQEH